MLKIPGFSHMVKLYCVNKSKIASVSPILMRHNEPFAAAAAAGLFIKKILSWLSGNFVNVLSLLLNYYL